MRVRGEYPPTSFSDLRSIQSLARVRPREALKKVCQEFEALFLHQILKGLDRTIFRSGFFPENLETKIYRDLFYQELAREMAGQGLGLAEKLYQKLSQGLPPEKFMPGGKDAEKGGRDG